MLLWSRSCGPLRKHAAHYMDAYPARQRISALRINVKLCKYYVSV